MAQYFGQYSGGYQWVPSNYYQMLTQPTQNIMQGVQGLFGGLAAGYEKMQQKQQAETAKMQQAQGMQMATQPSLEIAQRYAQQSGIPMPESLAAAAPNIGRMSPEQLQGFNQGLGSYMQYAQLQAAAAKAAQMQQQALQQQAADQFLSTRPPFRQ